LIGLRFPCIPLRKEDGRSRQAAAAMGFDWQESDRAGVRYSFSAFFLPSFGSISGGW